MSARIIILPVIAKDDAAKGQITLQVRVPRRGVYSKLLKLAGLWNVTPGEAAEFLLTRAVHETSGRRKK